MSSSQQPTSMENLPHDILRNILIRLPAKQLGRMRCVSKPWEFLLSQPSFVKSHLRRSINNLNDEIFLVLSNGNYYDNTFSVTAHDVSRSPCLDSPDFVKLPAIPTSYENAIFFGSVNGLICFGFRIRFTEFAIQIWNPSLSAILTVPPCDHCKHDYDSWHFRFGYDPKMDDYKLVKFTITSVDDAKDLVEGEVYSMRKGSWTLIKNRLPSHVSVLTDVETVCVDGHDGHLHWLGYVGERQMIVSFDLCVETFDEISLPDSVFDYNLRLGVYCGKLCVMSSNGDDYEVWVMNEYGVTESWVKMHVFSNSSGVMNPYGFTSNNKFLFRSLSDGLDFYDPSAEKVESININAGDPDEIKIVRYVDSLVWVAPAKH